MIKLLTISCNGRKKNSAAELGVMLDSSREKHNLLLD